MEKSLEEILADINREGEAKRVCSYCDKVMREGPENNITHGICKICSTKMLWMGGLSEVELTEFVKEQEGVQ